MDLQKQTLQERAGAPVAELRASDADRDRIADILREALAEGRLTADEHAERVEGVLGAKTVGELEVFIRDLPAAHARPAAPAYTPVPPRPTPGAIPVEADSNVVAVFSSARRRGRWRAGRRLHAYAVFGPVISFGLTGGYADLMADVAHRVTPLSDRDAREMVRSLRAAPLLEGRAGAPGVDLAALEETVLRLSAMVEDLPEIAALDLRPVRLLPPGAGIAVTHATVRLAHDTPGGSR
ncbi:acetate--CoA ligase family protein [Streptomyces sp. NPDC005921]